MAFVDCRVFHLAGPNISVGCHYSGVSRQAS